MTNTLLLLSLALGGPSPPAVQPLSLDGRGGTAPRVYWGPVVLEPGDAPLPKAWMRWLEGRGLPLTSLAGPRAAGACTLQDVRSRALVLGPREWLLADPWLRVLLPSRPGTGTGTGGSASWRCRRQDATALHRGHIKKIPNVPCPLRVRYEDHRCLARSGRNKVFHYAYAGSEAGEPLFRRNGAAARRTASEWLNKAVEADGDGRKDAVTGYHFFDTMDGRPPRAAGDGSSNLTPPVHLEGSETTFLAGGMLYFNARQVRLAPRRGAGIPTFVNMPGEPFEDSGVDLDRDGRICSARGPGRCCPERPATPREKTRCNEVHTIGNNRWDIELDSCDADREVCVPETRAPMAHTSWKAFAESHESASFPHGGAAPGKLERWAHEPFLNLDYGSPRNEETRVDFSARGQPVTRGRRPRSTTTGRDPVGALRSLPLNLHGVLFNEGAVVLDRHTVVFGGVYSNDRVHLRRQARVYFDDGITRQQPTTWSRDCRQAPRLFDDVIGTVEFYRKDGSLPPRRGDLHIRRR